MLGLVVVGQEQLLAVEVNAVDRSMIGRLPALPPPITTAWAATGGHVLVTTPPGPWEQHDLPRAVFETPENSLALNQ